MIDDPEAENDPDLLAAEYALGLLDDDARAPTEERIRTDPEFARRVRRWETVGRRWAGAMRSDPDWSPDGLWRRLEPAFPVRSGRALPLPANDPGATDGPARSARGWRLGTLAASLAALVFGGLYVTERDRAQQIGESLALARSQSAIDTKAIRVAQVTEPDGDPLLTALYEGTGGKLTVRIATISGEELVPELWVIGPDGKPRSLGQSASGSVAVIELTEQIRADIAAGGSIAISLEEASDQPSAQPTAERILGAAPLSPVS